MSTTAEQTMTSFKWDALKAKFPLSCDLFFNYCVDNEIHPHRYCYEVVWEFMEDHKVNKQMFTFRMFKILEAKLNEKIK